MIIKNEYVTIATGGKKIELKNTILDEYIKRIIENQFLTQNRKDLFLKTVVLKFDEELYFNEKSSLNQSDFDILIEGKLSEINIANNNITTQYTYPEQAGAFYRIYDANTHSPIYDFNNYLNKKITAIGFGTSSDEEILACLNTSNYNLYIQEEQILSITRKDIFSTDAVFYSPNQIVAGPIHLIEKSNDDYSNNYIGILYSIGLSSYIDYIDKEFVISKDVEKEINDNELIIKGIENYLSSDSSLFSDENLYPASTLYPLKTNYKYVIFKYKIYKMNYRKATDTGHYYYQAIPLDKFGKMNLKIKYERG